jgi:hypothetical protein
MVHKSFRSFVSRLFQTRRHPSPRRDRQVRRTSSAAEVLEVRSLLAATVLSTETLLFDPTPSQPANGDEFGVGLCWLSGNRNFVGTALMRGKGRHPVEKSRHRAAKV